MLEEQHPARILALLTAILLTAAPLLAAPVGVTVVVENRAPAGGTWLSPMWVGFHSGGFDAFDDGAAASSALEMLAEDGDPARLDNLCDTTAGTGVRALLAADGSVPMLAPSRRP